MERGEVSKQKMTGQASPRWAFMQPFDIYAKDNSGAVYLHRLRIVQTPFFAIYLHDINLPDSDRDPHDHPWTFWSIVLRGGYTERVWRVTPGQRRMIDPVKHQTWRRFSAHKMGFNQAHMIDTIEPGTKTLIITGPRRKSWGFYPDAGVRYLDWKDYLDV